MKHGGRSAGAGGSGEASEARLLPGPSNASDAWPRPGPALWAFRLGTDRDSDCRMQPRQTDAVDQFVTREANGCNAEGFSRQRDFISMNRSEESSLPGLTSVPSISGQDE